MKSAEEDGETYSEIVDKPLDTVPSEVVSDLLTAGERAKCKQLSPIGRNDCGGHHNVLRCTKETSLKYLCWPVQRLSVMGNVGETIETDRKLLQRPLNVVTAGRTVEMVSVLSWRTHNQSWCCVWLLYRGGLNQGSGTIKESRQTEANLQA